MSGLAVILFELYSKDFDFLSCKQFRTHKNDFMLVLSLLNPKSRQVAKE